MGGYAQEHIYYTMTQLMGKMPIDKIKVSDIVSAGHMNRKTFYYHFHGMDDLLKWMVAIQIDQLNLNDASPDNWKEKFSELTSCIYANRAFFSDIFSSKYAPEIETYMIGKLSRHMMAFINNCIAAVEKTRKKRIHIEQSNKEHIYSYYSRGVFSLVADWIRSDCKDSPELFLEIVDHLTSNTIFNVIDAFSSENA